MKRLPLSASIVVLALASSLAACGPGKSETETGTEGSSSSGGSSGAATTTGATATTTATTTGEPMTGGGPTDTGDATATGTSSGGSTTGGVACDLVALTHEQAEQLGPAKDCGIVDPWNNTVAEWQAAVTCVLEASAAEQPFEMVAWRMGIDSKVGTGYFGVAAESFARGTIGYDSYGEGSAELRLCTALTATPGCTVDLGEPCLTCEGASDGGSLCP